MIAIDSISDYNSFSFLPYIDISWNEECKERGVKTCIAIGWLFWEFYVDII